MDFLEFYGLHEEPFRLTPDPAYFFPSRSHTEGLLSLNHSTEHKEGFCLITGEPGMGKTTLLNVFIETWKTKAEIAMILTPRLAPEDFLVSVLEDLGIDYAGSNKNELIRSFRDFLVRKNLEGRTVIIIVDEAQNLPDETLEELRLLSNLETEKEKLLQIVIIGQTELLSRLATQNLRQLNQRILTRVALQPLNPDEVREYIAFRLSKAGRGFIRFDNSALKKLHKGSSGVPRLINTLATRALMFAFLEETMRVKAGHVEMASKSLNRTDDSRPRSPAFRPVYAWASTLIVAVFLAQYLLIPRYLHPSTPSPAGQTSGRAVAAPATPAGPSVQSVSPEPEPVAVSSPPGQQAPIAVKADPGKKIPAPPISPVMPARSAGAVPKSVRIERETANLRKTPSLVGEIIDSLKRGETVQVLDSAWSESGELWYLARIDEERLGWISARVVQRIEQMTDEKAEAPEDAATAKP